MATSSAEALVVGAGPVGLFSALSLLDRGVSVDIVDAAGPRLMRGYACGLHSGTLHGFERLGLLRSLRAQAHQVDRLALRNRAGATRWVGLRAAASDYPFMLTLSQSALEDLLEAELAGRGVRVAHNEAVSRVSPRDGFVQVTTESTRPDAAGAAAGRNGRTVREAAFMVGADGYDSTCRKALGIELVEMRPSKVFAVYDFRADLRQCQHEAALSFEGGASAFWPLDENTGRWTLELNEGFADEPSLDQLRCLLRQRAPWFAPAPEQLCWSAVAEFENRVARRFGNGRTWLAGDAAHCTTPIRFQSMNRGLYEAEELAALIAAALHGAERQPGAFARFDGEQQLVWRNLMGIGRAAAEPWLETG